MSACLGIFERKEMKYRLNRAQIENILPVLATRLIPTEYGDTSIRSLYYDTPSYELVARSIEAPLYKEKLRLRVYGNGGDPHTPAFVEIKKKYKGIVYKRRIALPLAAAEAFLSGVPYEKAVRMFPSPGSVAITYSEPAQSRQIANEIAFFIKRHGPLAPSILTMCRRRSLVDPHGSDLRVTIDTHLMANDGGRPQGIGDARFLKPLIPVDEAIMEIKSKAALPLWLASALSEAGAYKRSFSKCGSAYMQMNLHENSTYAAFGISRCPDRNPSIDTLKKGA